MDRKEWLKKIRFLTETVYDRLAPKYWVTYGFYDNQTHLQFIDRLVQQVKPPADVLDAACGAGRYDGLLLEKGYDVLGIDQSAGMLARAREHFPANTYPRLDYRKLGLQEMDFKSRFDAVICIDAMEHVFPEDWPEIVAAFHQALKPGGWLYFTVEVADVAEVKLSYDHAIALGLPVVPGEIADKVEPACEKILQMDLQDIPDELADEAVYHFYPALEQVRDWLSKAGFILQAEGLGHWYAHFLAQKVLQPLS